VTNDTAGIKPKSLKYPNSIVDTAELKSLLQGFSGNYKIMQQQINNMLVSYGPQFAIDVTLRIGKFINTEGEVITLLPVEPLIEHTPFHPNYQVNTMVSWRLTRSITIDYLYQYQLQNNDNDNNNIKIELSQHRVWLRYSFNSSR
jgi:hypothetical protein